MLNMTLQSIMLLVVAFGSFAIIGWLAAGKRKPVARRVSAFDNFEVIEGGAAAPARATPADVVHYDVAKAAEQFTSGVVAPREPQSADGLRIEPRSSEPRSSESRHADVQKPAYAPPEFTPRVDASTLRIHPRPDYLDTNLQGRVSSLASMTPDSVEAAVQQAGSGLEPMRLDGPRGERRWRAPRPHRWGMAIRNHPPATRGGHRRLFSCPPRGWRRSMRRRLGNRGKR